ncbi:MAG: FtsX-like permease family protein [Bacteroidales bacterium]|nr:FtsX-like permease family protein [Bacteroidales bacterium]
MKNYKMAWRNLWRNRRRTVITAASVFFAVFFALIMRSLQLGTYDSMYKNIIESYSGYIQVQDEEFWENKIVDNVFNNTSELRERIKEDKNVEELIPRFESFALASSGSRSKGVMVMGIDPEKEKLLSDVRDRLVKYRLTDEAIDAIKEEDIPSYLAKNLDLFRDNSFSSDGRLQVDLGIKENDEETLMPLLVRHAGVDNSYFSRGDNTALVGDRLARYLGLAKGDTIILLGQAYHGHTAAGKYVIGGIVKIPNPDLDNKIVYLPVDVCQTLYYAPGMLTSMVVHLEGNDDDSIEGTLERLGSKLDSPYRVLGWKEMNETLVQQLDADNKSGMIMIGILYLVIAFGVFGTVLMMTAERRREFGVLVAIGMQKTKLAGVLVYEMLYIGMLGILSGVAIAIPAIIYGYYHPIHFSANMAKIWEEYGFEPVMEFQWIDAYFISQSVVVAVIVLVAAIYPLVKIRKMKEVNALKA